MKCILVFPPQWTPLNPHFALASLYSQLKKNNCDVSIKDLNIAKHVCIFAGKNA